MDREEILVETIHTLLCDREHSPEMLDLLKEDKDETKCYYYLEKNITEHWNMKDHSYWKDQADKIKVDLRASSPDDALRSIYKLLDLLEKVGELSTGEYSLFTRLLQLTEVS